jgi:hypothetical protein
MNFFSKLWPAGAGRHQMRFILVNGRTPCRQSFCALCCQPIGASYLREIETQLSYCDDKCYAEHCIGAVMAIESHARELPEQPALMER